MISNNVIKNKKLNKSVSLLELGVSKLAFLLLICVIWTQNILLSYVRAVILRIPIVNNIADIFIPLLIGALFIFALPYVMKNIKVEHLLFVVVVAFVYVLQYVFYPDNTEYLNRYVTNFLLLIVPLFLVGVVFDWEESGEWLYVLSILTILIRFIYTIAFGVEKIAEQGGIEGGDMSASYHLLPHVIMVLLFAIKKPSFINVIFSILGVFLIFSFGSRGPLVCTLSSVVIYLIFCKKYKNPKLAFSLIICIALLIIFSFTFLMEQLNVLSENIGLSTRIFKMYSEGNFFLSEGRDNITETLTSRLWENVFGFGLTGDGIVVGSYAHNIFIELLFNFGVVLGSIIFVALVYVIFKNFIKSIKSEVSLFMVVLISSCFVKLFMSGTFLTEQLLFFLLGICVSHKLKIKNVSNE